MNSRSEMKSHVKDIFRKNWSKAILLTIIPVLISIFIGSYQQFNSMQNSEIAANYALHNLYNSVSIFSILGVISSLFTISATFQFIDWLKNKDLEFSPFKRSFRIFNGEDFWKIIGIMIIMSVFTFLWSLLFIIPGIIKSYSYSQAYNLYKEAKENGTDDQYNLVDYITQSKELMNGHKAELFILDLSFIGWLILSGITLGIASIWVTPYIVATKAEFFNNLIANK